MGYFDDIDDVDDLFGGSPAELDRPPRSNWRTPDDAIYGVAQDTGYDPEHLRALARLETRGGAATIKGGGTDTYNLFNIKDFSREGTGIAALDKAEGSRHRYRQYDDYEASVRDLVSLLDRRYPGARDAKSAEEFASALKAGGYATDPDYVKKLSGVARSLQAGKGETPRAREAGGEGGAGKNYFSDLEGLAGGWTPAPASPENAAPPVADKPWYSDAYEVGRQVGAGFAVDLPTMVGNVARYVSPDGSAVDNWGRSVVEAAEARAPGWEPDLQGRGLFAEALIKGGRGLPPALVPLAATLVNPFAGAGAAATLYGGSSAQETEDKLRLQGVDDDKAARAGLISGGIHGLGEAAASFVGGKLLGLAGSTLLGAKTTADVAARMTDSALVRPLAKGLSLNLLTQTGTEVAQDTLAEVNERYHGAAPEDMGQIARDSALGGFGLAVLLSPLGLGGHVRRSRNAQELERALNDPSVPDEVRNQARDIIIAEADRQKVAPEDREVWLDSQFMQDDAQARAERMAAIADEERALEQRALEQRAEVAMARAGIQQAEQTFMPQEVPQLGYDPAMRGQGPAIYNQGTVTVNPQGQATLTPEDELAARYPGAVPQAQQAPSPEQQRAQAIREAAAETARQQEQVQADAAGFGITLPGAVATYADLEQLHTNGLIDDAQFASAAGRLAGKATALGQVRKEINAVRKAAEADARAQQLVMEQQARVAAAAQAEQDALVAQLQQEAARAPAAQMAQQAGAVAAQPPQTPVPAGAGGTTAAPRTPAKKPKVAAKEAAARTARAEFFTPGNVVRGFGGHERVVAYNAPDEAGNWSVQVQPVVRENGQWVDSPNQGPRTHSTAPSAREMKNNVVERASAAPATTAQEATTAAQGTAIDGYRRAEMDDTRTRLLGAWKKATPEGRRQIEEATGLEVMDDPDTGAPIFVHKTRTTNVDFETDAARELRTNLLAHLDTMPENDSLILQRFLGAEIVETTNENGEIERDVTLNPQGAASYREIGQMMPNSRTGGTGVARQMVYKHMRRLLKEAGFEDGSVSPRVLRDRVQAQLAGLDYDTLHRNTDHSSKEDDGWGDGPDSAAGLGDAAATTEDTADIDRRGVNHELRDVGFTGAHEDDGAPGRTREDEDESGYDTLEADVQRAREESASLTDLREVLADDLAEGRVLESDITETRDAINHLAARGKVEEFDHLRALTQAEAVRTFARNREAARAAMEKTDDRQTGARTGAKPAPRPAKAVPGRTETGGDAALHRGGAEDASGGAQVREAADQAQDAPVVGDGSKSAATVVTKKKRRIAVQDVGARARRPAGTLQDGEQFRAQGEVLTVEGVYSSDELRLDPTVDDVLSAYEGDGMGHIVDGVENWVLTDADADVLPGLFFHDNGVPTIAVAAEELGRSNAPLTLHHEIGHSADLLYGTSVLGEFSGRPELGLTVQGTGARERLVATGAVTAEVIAFVRANPDSPLTGILSYPLDRKSPLVRGMDATETRQELFAQLWALSILPKGRQRMQRELPVAAAFMEKVHATARSQAYKNAARAARKAVSDQAARAGTGGVQRPNDQAAPKGSARAVQRSVAARAQRTSDAKARELNNPALERSNAAMRGLWDTVKGAADWAIKRAAFTEDLAAMAAKVLPQTAQQYTQAVREIDAERKRAEREIDAILEGYRELLPHERGTGKGSVNAFLKASTMSGEWGYDSGIPGAKYDADSETAKQFRALTPKAQKLVRDVFQRGHDALKQMQDAVRLTARTEYDALTAAAEAAGDTREVERLTARTEYDALTAAAEAAGDTREVERLTRKKDAQLKRFDTLLKLNSTAPYAPLKRFGNHVVVGMSRAYLDAERDGDMRRLQAMQADPQHYFVAFRETKREAQALRQQIALRFPDSSGGYNDSFRREDAQHQLYGGRDALGAFGKLRELVNNTQDSRLQGAAGRALDTLMTDLHLSLLADQSVRQSERHRVGVHGAEDDMMRAFASQGRAQAHFIAGLKSQGRVQDALFAMREETDARTPGRAERREFFNELVRRHVMGLDYQPSPIADKMMAGTSMWMLLTSPAHFVVNATQPWAMTLPTMAGHHGYARSAKALAQAYADIFPLVKDGSITQDEYARLPDDVQADIETLANRGRIDISLSHDLGAWRSHGEGADQMVGKVVGKMRAAAQTVESVNRITTAIAALRLERERPSGAKSPLDYADKLIYDTHGDYSGFNAPRIMRTPTGRLATQFRKFQLIQLSLFARLLHRSFKGASPEERGAARWATAFNMGTMLAVGGLLGLPGAQVAGWVLRQAFGDDDEPDNPELTLRRMAGGGVWADVLTKGLPTLLGVDVSGRIGAGQMLSLLPYADLDASRKGYESAAVAAMGPFLGGVLPNVADGVGLMYNGQFWQGMEKLLPKGAADLSRAVRYQAQGLQDRRGETLLAPEDVSTLASLSQALGLPNKELTDRQARASAAYTTSKHFDARTTAVKEQYIAAYRSNDAAGMQEARDAWTTLQAARVRYGYTRQPMSSLFRAPRERVRQEQNVVQGVRYRADAKGLAEVW